MIIIWTTVSKNKPLTIYHEISKNIYIFLIYNSIHTLDIITKVVNLSNAMIRQGDQFSDY